MQQGHESCGRDVGHAARPGGTDATREMWRQSSMHASLAVHHAARWAVHCACQVGSTPCMPGGQYIMHVRWAVQHACQMGSTSCMPRGQYITHVRWAVHHAARWAVHHASQVGSTACMPGGQYIMHVRWAGRRKREQDSAILINHQGMPRWAPAVCEGAPQYVMGHRSM